MRTIIKFFIVLGFILTSADLWSFGQVAISNDDSDADGSAMLDVKSTSKGLLIPRMTQSQIGEISNPANGLQVFCTTDNRIYIYITTAMQWKEVSYGTGTITPLTCGLPFTISHLTSRGVAPVDKTVTYGTVTNIPGETSKCWITSNLGADHQATAVNDATEASAGWYWQFNRQQGYKHDGTTITPNTTWITSIDENFDWQAANDPCALELGSDWRIPTRTEWENVDGATIWTNWNGPWNSALKMHAAGYLHPNGGSPNARGGGGYYWSIAQANTTRGLYFYFTSGYSTMGSGAKATGLTLRCLRDEQLLTTAGITNILTISATSGGFVNSDGGSLVTARGVCWSTSSNPTTADSHTSDGNGTGLFISNLTGLTPNTLYHVRAYATNSLRTSYGNEMSFTTLAWSCGFPFTISHLASGGVAPVDKTVNYGTVTNMPGETSKCWITSNLGADHQATAVNDATEASAGWYWQFNRQQGYKHDGTTRTPNTTWITSISENFNWQAANDPCALELGTGWRIPTTSEWINVNNTGGWVNWNGPWNSNLKLHGAGLLNYSDGSLLYRNSTGFYWTSVQATTDIGNLFCFDSGGSYMRWADSKATGSSLRCIK